MEFQKEKNNTYLHKKKNDHIIYTCIMYKFTCIYKYIYKSCSWLTWPISPRDAHHVIRGVAEGHPDLLQFLGFWLKRHSFYMFLPFIQFLLQELYLYNRAGAQLYPPFWLSCTHYLLAQLYQQIWLSSTHNALGVGWVGAWGGACYRSLLLEHNAHIKENNILVEGHIMAPEQLNGRGHKRSGSCGYKRSSFRGYQRCTILYNIFDII